MIKKLKVVLKPEDLNLPVNELEMRCFKNLLLKIDELVDAVNSIVSVQEKLIDSRFVVETKHEEPADPYAEQRKWIGCLCRFWFDNKKQADIGILGDIDEGEIHPYFNADLGHNYKCCEPVKPDDDIIYKGGDDD